MQLTKESVVAYALEGGLVQTAEGVTVEILTGGVSCAAFRLHPLVGNPIVIKQSLPQLRVSAEWFADPARSHREALFLEVLHQRIGKSRVPELLLNDPDNFIIAMSSAPLKATNWKSDLLEGKIERGVAAEVGSILGEMQSVPLQKVPGALWDKRYFAQLRLDAYLLHVADKLPWANAELLRVVDELQHCENCLVHGDYTPKNLLVSGNRVIVLDFEVGHVGHPAFDVASIVNHLFLKSVFRKELASGYFRLTRAFLEGYMKASSRSDLPPRFREVLGGLMLARVHGKSPAEYLHTEHKPVVTDAGRRLLEKTSTTDLEQIWPGLS